MKVANFRSIAKLAVFLVLGTQVAQAQVTLDFNPYYSKQERIFLNNVRLLGGGVNEYTEACEMLATLIRFRLSDFYDHNPDELPLVTDAMIQVYLRYCVNPHS